MVQTSSFSAPAHCRTDSSQTLRTWDNELQKGFKKSGLDEIEVAAKIFRSSTGIIGWAAVLIERAGTLAARDLIKGKCDHITEAHLKAAHDLLASPVSNPFKLHASRFATPDGESAPVIGTAAQDFHDIAQGVVADDSTLANAAKGNNRKAAPDRNFRP